MRVNYIVLAVSFCIVLCSVNTVFADWSTSVVLPYNAPPYVAQWETDNQVIVFTMTNHSDAPAAIMLELTMNNDAGQEILHGTSVPFLMPNNNPRAIRSPDLIRWKQIVWNPLFRRSYANPGRLPEGNLNVCVQVYEWNKAKGAKLSEACGKTFVGYPDIPKLTKPADDSHLSALPTFTWQRPDIPENVSLHYMLKIAEITHGATPDAALQDKAAYNVTVDGLSYALSPDAFQLKYGGNYAWRVVALDQYGNPATAHNGESRASKFSFDPINETQKLRIVTMLKKNATDFLTAASSQGDAAAQAIAKLAKDKIASASLSQSFMDISKTLSNWIDSLAHANAAPALVNNVIAAQFAISYAADLTGGQFPLAGSSADSLLAVCVARAKGLRSAATGMEIAPADSLVRRLTVMRSGMGLHRADLATIVENFSWLYTSKDNDLETTLLSSTEEAFTTFLNQVWKAGAYLADAASQSQIVQTNAPKNAQASVSQITDKLVSAMKQLAAVEAGGSLATATGQINNISEGIESLRHMKGAQGQALSAITEHLDGMQAAVANCLKVLSGASSASAGSPTGTIAAELEKLSSSVSKKGANDVSRAIGICQQAGAGPSAQANALDETEKIVQSLMKSEKEKDGIPAIISHIESMKSVLAQGSIYNEAGDAAATASRGIKDANATAVCKAIADNCHADAADASAHPFTPEEAIRRAQNIIHDANTLDEMTGGSSSLAAQVAPMLESKVIAPNLLNDPSMQDVKTMMSQKGVTDVAFGSTADNAFAQVSGSTIMLNASLGSEPPPVLKYFIVLGLNAGMATTLEGIYGQNELAAGILYKGYGSKMNTRADFSLDLKTLGEQEAKRMFRAMPAYSNVADH